MYANSLTFEAPPCSSTSKGCMACLWMCWSTWDINAWLGWIPPPSQDENHQNGYTLNKISASISIGMPGEPSSLCNLKNRYVQKGSGQLVSGWPKKRTELYIYIAKQSLISLRDALVPWFQVWWTILHLPKMDELSHLIKFDKRHNCKNKSVVSMTYFIVSLVEGWGTDTQHPTAQRMMQAVHGR